MTGFDFTLPRDWPFDPIPDAFDETPAASFLAPTKNQEQHGE